MTFMPTKDRLALHRAGSSQRSSITTSKPSMVFPDSWLLTEDFVGGMKTAEAASLAVKGVWTDSAWFRMRRLVPGLISSSARRGCDSCPPSSPALAGGAHVIIGVRGCWADWQQAVSRGVWAALLS